MSENKHDIRDFATLFVALATTGSVIYLARQVNVTRQQTMGQFLLSLDDHFEAHTEITLLFLRSTEPFVPDKDQWLKVWAYMSLFERISIMVDAKILDIGLVDRLYGFRIESVVLNDAVFEQTTKMAFEWLDFIDLCCRVGEHRRKQPGAEPQHEFFKRVDRLTALRSTPRQIGAFSQP